MTSIDQILFDAVSRGVVPAVAAMAATPSEVIYEGAFGKTDVARNVDLTPDAIFRVASMTKAITSVCAMSLHEEGAFDLDEPAARFAPELADLRVLDSFDPATGELQTVPRDRDITFHHLLTHTSGIGYTSFSPVLHAIKEAGHDENVLLFQPGTDWVYGTNVDILGRIIESITGNALDVVMRERVFGPLDMRDSGYRVPPSDYHRYPTQHQRGPDEKFHEVPNTPEPDTHPSGGGGVRSRARLHSDPTPLS